MTRVVVDGVDRSATADLKTWGERLAQPLESLASIEIETVPTAALLRQGLSEAAGALETLCVAACRIGVDFRGHDVKGASKELVSLAQSLGTLVTLIGVVGQALDVDFSTFAVSGGSAKALFEETGTQIGSLVQAQQDQDWITVADTLEYDVSPTLPPVPMIYETTSLLRLVSGRGGFDG